MLLAISMLVSAVAYDAYKSAIGIHTVPEIRPKTGDENSATAGDKVVWTETARLAEGALISEHAVLPLKSASVDVPTGSPLYRIDSTRPYKACMVKQMRGGDMPCLIDDDGDGTFDRFAKDFFDSARPLPNKIAYSRVQDIRIPASSSGFVREIRYQGATQDSLRLSYREYSDDLARQAFTEDLSIPLGTKFPQTVAVKGLIITVKAIGPMGMIYSLDQVKAGSGWDGLPTD